METNTATLTDSEKAELQLFLKAVRLFRTQLEKVEVCSVDWVGVNIKLGKLDSRLWNRGLTKCEKAVEALEQASLAFDTARASGERLRSERKHYLAERAGRPAQRELASAEASYVAEVAAMTRR